MRIASSPIKSSAALVQPARVTTALKPAIHSVRPARCQAANNEGSSLSVEDLLAEANALLQQAASKPNGGSFIIKSMEEEVEQQEVEYVCDESGCVVVFPGAAASEGSGGLGVTFSGEEWKLDAQSKIGTITGSGWEISAQQRDITSFVEVLQRLAGVVANLAAVGEWVDRSEDRPSSKVKWESGGVFMQATYSTVQPLPSFAIEFTITSADGGVESGFWSARVVKEALALLAAQLPPLEVELRKASPPVAPVPVHESTKVPTASNA